MGGIQPPTAFVPLLRPFLFSSSPFLFSFFVFPRSIIPPCPPTPPTPPDSVTHGRCTNAIKSRACGSPRLSVAAISHPEHLWEANPRTRPGQTRALQLVISGLCDFLVLLLPRSILSSPRSWLMSAYFAPNGARHPARKPSSPCRNNVVGGQPRVYFVGDGLLLS